MHRTLLVHIVVLLTAACSGGPRTTAPTSPSAPGAISAPAPVGSPSLLSAPVEGTVRASDGAPLAGAYVTSFGYGAFAAVVTDASGRFSFPSAQVAGRFPLAQVRVYCPGFVDTYRDVPFGTGQAPPLAVVDISMRQGDSLIEDRPVEMTLTNADADYGHDANIGLGLPGARGPVKIITLQPRTFGAVEVRAVWTGQDRLEMWVEKLYREVSIQATISPLGENVLTLHVPAMWAIDAMNPAVITIGLPRSARATGGLSAPVPIRLSVTPVP